MGYVLGLQKVSNFSVDKLPIAKLLLITFLGEFEAHNLQ